MVKAAERLSGFAYLQARLDGANRAEVVDLVSEYDAIRSATMPAELAKRVRAYSEFLRPRAHILAAGTLEWSARRILLQLAVEYSDDSVVTADAEAWMAAGGGKWVWAKRVNRPKVAAREPLVRMVGEAGVGVSGVFPIDGDRVLSWMKDSFRARVRCWHLDSGIMEWESQVQPANGRDRALGEAGRHREGGVFCALEVVPGKCWALGAHGGALSLVDRIGNLRNGQESHSKRVSGMANLPDGTLLAWSTGGSILVTDSLTGFTRGRMTSESKWIVPGEVVSRGCLATGGTDGTIDVWDLGRHELAARLCGHTAGVTGMRDLGQGRLLSWSSDGTLRVWDANEPWEAYPEAGPLSLRRARASGDAFGFGSGRVLSWTPSSGDENGQVLCLWDMETGGIWRRRFVPLSNLEMLGEPVPNRLLGRCADLNGSGFTNKQLLLDATTLDVLGTVEYLGCRRDYNLLEDDIFAFNNSNEIRVYSVEPLGLLWRWSEADAPTQDLSIHDMRACADGHVEVDLSRQVVTLLNGIEVSRCDSSEGMDRWLQALAVRSDSNVYFAVGELCVPWMDDPAARWSITAVTKVGIAVVLDNAVPESRVADRGKRFTLLALMHGNQRITVEEARRLLAAAPAVVADDEGASR